LRNETQTPIPCSNAPEATPNEVVKNEDPEEAFFSFKIRPQQPGKREERVKNKVTAGAFLVKKRRPGAE